MYKNLSYSAMYRRLERAPTQVELYLLSQWLSVQSDFLSLIQRESQWTLRKPRFLKQPLLNHPPENLDVCDLALIFYLDERVPIYLRNKWIIPATLELFVESD